MSALDVRRGFKTGVLVGPSLEVVGVEDEAPGVRGGRVNRAFPPVAGQLVAFPGLHSEPLRRKPPPDGTIRGKIPPDIGGGDGGGR